MAKDDKGYEVLDTVDIIQQRDLPNSDPAQDSKFPLDDSDNASYQKQPWDRSEDRK